MISYHLTSDQPGADAKKDLQKIIDYLLTFVGDVGIKKENDGHATISYSDTLLTATLATTGQRNRQITLTCQKNDTVSVHLIKNITKQIGYRIFNPQTLSYMVNDPNVLDLTTADVDDDIRNIIKKYRLHPLFQYRDSLVFYAKDTSGTIHLINRHLLEFLHKHPQKKLFKKDFSVAVAGDIGRFVALFDRGLIPLSFYKCVNEPKKIINLSGFSIDKMPQNVVIEQINFLLDVPRQTFVQHSSQNITIKKGQSLFRSLKIKNYLAMKIAQDIGYDVQGKSLVPKLKVLVFLDC